MYSLKKGIYLFLFAILFIGAGCKKSTTCNGVPNVAVSFSINTLLPSYNALTVTGGSLEVTGGYAGIVIYRQAIDQFNAFDCCCTYDGAANGKAIVVIQGNKILVTCPVCGSSFLLTDGSVSHGPATCGLKPYATSYDGVSNLYVSN
jgi:nitrite reductase/ring-hydroxylating ferredoxin subunit